jgi:Collagen triple helix repeat (20 copies)
MVSIIRKRLTYANAALTLAVLFAMSGGAYAAGKYLITSTKQISPKVLHALSGKPGAKGADGTTGPAGAAGPQGSQGPQGPQGAKGEKGENGTNGTNGANGTNGKDGSPWTASGTLPKGKTETGTWSISAGPENFAIASIGFTLPLAKALGASEVHYVEANGNGTTCPGSAAAPEAEAGNLCVYQVFAQGVEETGSLGNAIIRPGNTPAQSVTQGTATSGALITLPKEEKEEPAAWGAWAVTEK